MRYKSPTGSPIVGTLETIVGIGMIKGIDVDGTPDYVGETDIFWDDQITVVRDGKIIFVDDDGDEWTFDQLTVE